MAKVRGQARRIRPTVFHLQQRQRCRLSTSHRRDTGHTHITPLHQVTSHLQMVTLMATANRTNPLIIQFTLVTLQSLYILRIQALTDRSLPPQARRLPHPPSKRLTIRW